MAYLCLPAENSEVSMDFLLYKPSRALNLDSFLSLLPQLHLRYPHSDAKLEDSQATSTFLSFLFAQGSCIAAETAYAQ